MSEVACASESTSALTSFVPVTIDDIEQSAAARFELQVRRHGSRLATRSASGVFTYAELNRQANRMARAILECRGAGNEPVALLLDHDAAMPVAVLGVLKAGKFYVPLDPSSSPANGRAILDKTGARLLVASRAQRQQALAIVSKDVAVLLTDEVSPRLSGENLGLSIPPDAIAYVIFTSGSTGQPKGTIQTQRNLLQNVRNFTNSVHIAATDRISLLASYSFAASISSLFGALLNGAALLPFSLKTESLDRLACWLGEEGITIYHSVPSVFRQWARRLTGSGHYRALRVLKLGGEPVYRHDFELYQKHFSEDCIFYVGLGASEMNTICAFKLTKETLFPGNVVPVGFPAPDVEVTLMTEEGRQAGPGEVGEIVLKSAYLFREYWRQPEWTRSVLQPAPEGGGKSIFRTGDLGRFLPDGALLHLGRKDFQVKIRGIRVELGEIETALLDATGVQEAAVVAQEDRFGEKSLVAFVVPDETGRPLSSIRNELRETLPAHMIPARFKTLERLPVNRNGKVDRLTLATQAGEFVRTGVYVPPQSTVEARLCALWEAVLGVERIGIEENFFDLGGHSLLAARLVSELEKLFGCKLPSAVLFQAPTVQLLAQRLSQEDWKSPWSALVPLQPHGSKPPVFFVHGWGGDVYAFLELARLLGPDQPAYGLQAVGLDGKEPRDTRVEQMATRYAQEIQRFYPQGPYCLAGYSIGGFIAYEIAQQLAQDRRPAAMVALIDTDPLRRMRRSTYLQTLWVYLLDRSRLHLAHRPKFSGRHLWGYLRSGGNRVQYWATRNQLATAPTPTPPPHAPAIPHATNHKDYYQAVTLAYRLRRYPGALELILSQEAPPYRACAWRYLARGGVAEHRVQCMHDELLSRKHVQDVATALKSALHRYSWQNE